jgi:hypothetical protein
MGKRKKNRAARPPSTEELLTEKVSQFLGAQNITPMMVYDLLLMGHRCYRQGLGLPHETVWKSILDGFRDHDRYYLTPGQNAALHGRDQPTEGDYAELIA